MNRGYLVLLGAAVMLAPACTDYDSSGGGPQPLPLPAGPPIVAPPVRAKPTYAQARQFSDQIKVGMPQSQVESMFGQPDKAGFKEYGSQTPNPWRALVWEYVFEDVSPARVLSIVFQEAQPGDWRVNHGDWPVP